MQALGNGVVAPKDHGSNQYNRRKAGDIWRNMEGKLRRLSYGIGLCETADKQGGKKGQKCIKFPDRFIM